MDKSDAAAGSFTPDTKQDHRINIYRVVLATGCDRLATVQPN
jgi:hypothetical protein